jgi:hypothetical protein
MTPDNDPPESSPQAEYAVAVNNDASVRVECTCGNSAVYKNTDQFQSSNEHADIEYDAHHAFYWVLANDEFRITCPRCAASGNTASLVRTPHDEIIIETGDTEEAGQPFFAPAASLSEKRAMYVKLHEHNNAAVHIECGCGHQSVFAEYDAFHTAIKFGDILGDLEAEYSPYALAADDFTITCPDCNGTGNEAVLYGQTPPFNLVLNINQPHTCHGCKSYVNEEGISTGPDAPEIGWTYYECPECGRKAQLNSVGLEK